MLSNTRAYGQKCYKYLIFFYSLFSLLSHHFLLFSSFSFYLRVSDIKPLQPTSITFFSSHSRCFSLFLLASPHQLLDLMLISVAVLWFFFFFLIIIIFLQWFDTWFDSGWVEMVMDKSMVVGCDGQIQWWVGWLVMGESVVVGSNVWIRWWEGRPVDGFQRMGRQWVSGWVGGGSGWVCGMRWVVFLVFVFVFLFWWLWFKWLWVNFHGLWWADVGGWLQLWVDFGGCGFLFFLFL